MTHHKVDPLRALTGEEREVLTQISRAASEPASHVARARALLAVAEGKNYSEAAQAAGRPLRPAILYSDNRALAQLAEINTALGLSLTAQAITPKWRWLAEHEPGVVRAAWCVLSGQKYVVYRLTGAPSMDSDTASIVGGVFDSARKTWDERAHAALGLAARLLPPLHA